MKPDIGSELASTLSRLDVPFILGQSPVTNSSYRNPAKLLSSLAACDEARLRLAIIPLLLRHPEFSSSVTTAVQMAQPDAVITLKCYYTAAVILQRKYTDQLCALFGKQTILLDFFSNELGLSLTEHPETDLSILGQRHQFLSGFPINWTGTYEHAVKQFLHFVQRRQNVKYRK